MPPKKEAAITPQQLRKFAKSRMDLGSLIFIIGPSKEERSDCLTDFLFHLRNRIETAIVFSETEHTQQTFSEVLPKTYIHAYPRLDFLDRVIERQSLFSKSLPTGVSNVNTLLIFHDVVDTKILKSSQFSRLISNREALQITILITTTTVTNLKFFSSQTKSCIDYVVTLNEASEDERKKLFTTFFHIFGKKEQFSAACDSYFEGGGSLVFNSKIKLSKVVDDIVFWNINDHAERDFTLGGREYWCLDELYCLTQEKINWEKYKETLRTAQNTQTAIESMCADKGFQKLDQFGKPYEDGDL